MKKNYGIILVADVVNSSLLKGHQLQSALERMSEFARGHAICHTSTGMILHCLLDSFIVVLPDCDAYREVLEFASEWVHHMQSSTFALDIRVAVHFGTYFVSDALNMVVGAGPNECSRLIRIFLSGRWVSHIIERSRSRSIHCPTTRSIRGLTSANLG